MQVAAVRTGQHRNQAAPSARSARQTLLRTYGPVFGLLLLTAATGQVSPGISRLLFMVGCFCVARLAYKEGGFGLHVEVSIILFVLAPFLRRIIDYHGGFDASGMLLVGPLLALTAVLSELRLLLSNRFRRFGVLTPFLIIIACLIYGWTFSALTGKLLPGTIFLAKLLIPMLYSICLIVGLAESDKVLRSAVRGFLIVSPIMGMYGIYQYLSPPPWDTFWMSASKMLAIGLPLPRMVRVFSTMNSPSSFAFYAICGMMLFGLGRPLRQPLTLIALIPLGVSLLLSGVRTAWISMAVSLAFCLLFGRSRGRAGLLIAVLTLGVAFTLLYTSFGDTIMSRFNTLGSNVSQDGSGSERMHDYIYIFTEGSSRYMFGTGLAMANDLRLAAVDGQLLMSVVQMGMVIGIIHTLAILWCGGQALFGIGDDRNMLRIAAGAVVVGLMSSCLLLSFTLGEFGFLFWMIVGILSASERAVPVQR